VSGPAPETERERQLRAFANRLLSWPDPEGPSTVDLMPLGYPDDLPAELVDYADLRFLGSVVRRRAGELLSIQLLFEMAADANDLLERYERSLIELGWQNVNQPGLHRGGFSGGDMPKTSVLVNVEKRIRVYPSRLIRRTAASFMCTTTHRLEENCPTIRPRSGARRFLA
jgi:hypothetical protein